MMGCTPRQWLKLHNCIRDIGDGLIPGKPSLEPCTSVLRTALNVYGPSCGRGSVVPLTWLQPFFAKSTPNTEWQRCLCVCGEGTVLGGPNEGRWRKLCFSLMVLLGWDLGNVCAP